MILCLGQLRTVGTRNSSRDRASMLQPESIFGLNGFLRRISDRLERIATVRNQKANPGFADNNTVVVVRMIEGSEAANR